MRYRLRFLWNATKGHRLAPWRSPYLLWRIETYCGIKMTQIGFLEFWEFLWWERASLWRFLKWTAEMERYAHPKPKSAVASDQCPVVSKIVDRPATSNFHRPLRSYDINGFGKGTTSVVPAISNKSVGFSP
jgi:hypothetical protein